MSASRSRSPRACESPHCSRSVASWLVWKHMSATCISLWVGVWNLWGFFVVKNTPQKNMFSRTIHYLYRSSKKKIIWVHYLCQVWFWTIKVDVLCKPAPNNMCPRTIPDVSLETIDFSGPSLVSLLARRHGAQDFLYLSVTSVSVRIRLSVSCHFPRCNHVWRYFLSSTVSCLLLFFPRRMCRSYGVWSRCWREHHPSFTSRWNFRMWVLAGASYMNSSKQVG